VTPDSQAILLLCSHLGLPPEREPAPLTLREWNPMAQRLAASSDTPGALLGLGAEDIRKALDISEQDARRLARLLDRGGALAIELERLESLGIWAMTRADERYPARFRERLKDSAPAVLFGSGDARLLGKRGLAVVGSRNVDEAGRQFAEFIGNACAESGLVVYSGGARGVDAMTMGAAFEAGGSVVGVLADSLERAVRTPGARTALASGSLAMTTPYSPSAGFTVGMAMGRNKLIYALADWALVIACDAEKGGTWSGASEALKSRWVPVFALDGEDVPEGNRLLINKGAQPFPNRFPDSPSTLAHWLEANSASGDKPEAAQFTLF